MSARERETHKAWEKAWRINESLTKERDAALSTIAKVEALHRRSHAVLSWRDGLRFEDPCPDCDGKAGVHPCGCWADVDTEFVCIECYVGTRGQSVPWPCPTIRALGSAPSTGEGNEDREKLIEAAARRVHALTEADPFEDYHPNHQESMRRIARAALAAPVAVDKAKLRKVISASVSNWTWDKSEWDMGDSRVDPGPMPERILKDVLELLKKGVGSNG